MYSRFEPEESNEHAGQEARRLLHSYLERACAADNAAVSDRERAELRQEMSGHILALATAHEELGATPDEAMQAALRQFGSAEQIGHEVVRELGQRPSWLGSPLTISMIGGLWINWFTLTGANALMANVYPNAISMEAQWFGIALGCISGGVIGQRRKSVRQAALWNAGFSAGMTFGSLAALCAFLVLISGNRKMAEALLSRWWWHLAGPELLHWLAVAGIGGAISGALMGLWCGCVRRMEADANDPAAVA